jgi:ADP-heptose:LPS heptosyltransferase
VQLKKILIIRFSSIGDIVLTTPVIRSTKRQIAGAELHFVTKETFRNVLINNPYVDKLHTFRKDISELYETLSAENYDVVIDLHKNLRSYRLRKKLKVRSYSFNKLNVKKYLAVNFKMLHLLPDMHIVDRYFETLLPLGVKNDGQGLEYYLKPEDKVNVSEVFFNGIGSKFTALVVGGSYYTKKIPLNKLKEICANSKLPLILLGDYNDKLVADELQKFFPAVINACGQFSVNESASVIQQAEWVITSDTGLMHIAAAFNKKVLSVWGSTIPEFGMGPYMPHRDNRILEVKGLSCRPCSKLGYAKCPLGHFKCMNEIDFSGISELI